MKAVRAHESMAPMSARYERPDWAARLIAMGESAGGVVEGARRLLPLDPDELIGQALESVGEGGSLPDFGTPDWRERFSALVRVIDNSRCRL